MDKQLVLNLPHCPALGQDDFLVSDCNAEAVRLINGWPHWPGRVCVIVGPPGSGKTHLVNVWRARSGAPSVPAAVLDEAGLDGFGRTAPIALEDVDRGPFDERALFHLVNLAREHQFEVLLTARSMPGEWRIDLPDLRSRLRSAVVATIGEPDDGLLKAVLVKLFADRQLAVGPEVIDYLMVRIERSMAAAQHLVALLDAAALSERRRMTRRLAAQVLADMGVSSDAEPGEQGGPEQME